MKNNALVLLWKGEEMPDYLTQKVAEVLVCSGITIPEMLTMKYMDEKDIAEALLQNVNNSKQFITVDTKQESETAEAVKWAIIYIGKRFENSLKGANGDLSEFALQFQAAVIVSRRKIRFDEKDDELLKAMDIISSANAVIPASIAKKYHFTQNVVNIIKATNRTYVV